jgi:very-short-patch-repair endonuclease
MTSPAQTFLDLADDLDLVDMVVVGDSLVRAGVARPEELVAASAAYRGRQARSARRAAAYVRGGVDSPMESRLRMLLILAGLPEPVVNHALRDEIGRVLYRLDLSYPQWRVAIEYDGRQHAENTAQWRWDVQRREGLDANGWRLVVVLSGDLYRSPARTLERVVSAARAQGVSLRLRSDEWRRYFPQRD